MASKAPVMKINVGQISAALWENEITVEGKAKTVLKATVSRRYRDKNGEWKSSQSFSRNELPFAIYALQKAFEAMIEAPEEPGDSSDEEAI